jgi:hypothetical protein
VAVPVASGVLERVEQRHDARVRAVEQMSEKGLETSPR